MSQTDAMKFLDLIRVPPTDDLYGHLKDRLLQMYALSNYACYKAISSLPLSCDMLPFALMLKMLVLLRSGHEACFFLWGGFLKHLPADIRSHLVHNRTTGTLYLWLFAPMRFTRAKSSWPPL